MSEKITQRTVDELLENCHNPEVTRSLISDIFSIIAEKLNLPYDFEIITDQEAIDFVAHLIEILDKENLSDKDLLEAETWCEKEYVKILQQREQETAKGILYGQKVPFWDLPAKAHTRHYNKKALEILKKIESNQNQHTENTDAKPKNGKVINLQERRASKTNEEPGSYQQAA